MAAAGPAMSDENAPQPGSDAIDRYARRRGQILDAAARLFSRRGYRQADVQELAEQLNIGKGTIYRNFPSKEALFFGAVDRAMQLLQARIHAEVEPHEDPLDRIAAAIRGYLAFFDEHIEVVELLMQERAEFHGRKKPTYFEYRDTAHAEWQPLLQQLIDEGRIRPVPISRIQDVMSDTLYGAIFTNVFAGRHKSFEAQAEDILDVLFRGFLTDSERRRRTGGTP
jgi:AcrR family transcriptional regulator